MWKMRVLIAIALVKIPVSLCSGAVVANNIPEDEPTAMGWNEVGLIAPGWNASNNSRVGQYFSPTLSGKLSTVKAIIAAGITHRIKNSPPLDVSIYTANGNMPAIKLGTKTLSATDLYPLFDSNTHDVTVDFTPLGIELDSGEGYMVVFESPYGVVGEYGTDAPYQVGFFTYSPLTLGVNYSRAGNGIDWKTVGQTPSNAAEFAMTVRTVPEPSSMLLSLVLAAFRCGRQLK